MLSGDFLKQRGHGNIILLSSVPLSEDNFYSTDFSKQLISNETITHSKSKNRLKALFYIFSKHPCQ